ncbi:hypothetical protein [Tardiphaga robiniae]|uniref:hypothetical protein n=1 Tax=Tardiphaga robiniae TaxID=943830 RepID=UPI001FCE95E6|nr:hypothetical protein [Tardiphaga robiniae]
MMHEVGRNQCDIVLMQGRADAELAAKAGIGEILVADRALRGVIAHHHHARAHRQSDPLLAAQLRRDCLVDQGRGGRLRQIVRGELRGLVETDGHQHVGRGGVALGLHALDEIVLDVSELDRDPGRRREGGDDRLDQLRFARRIEIDLLGAACGHAEAQPRRCQRNQSCGGVT